MGNQSNQTPIESVGECKDLIFLATYQLSNKPKNVQNEAGLGEIYLKHFRTL